MSESQNRDVQEGIEPLLIGTSLLQRIEFQPGMQTVFPAIEPLRAEQAGDGMDLPIYNINIGGAQSFGVTVSRHGLRLKIQKRFVDESSYPWINFWLRLAGLPYSISEKSFYTRSPHPAQHKKPRARANKNPALSPLSDHSHTFWTSAAHNPGNARCTPSQTVPLRPI